LLWGRWKKTKALFILLLSAQAVADYNRSDWPHWKDIDDDCQNTRAEILIRDSSKDVVFRSIQGCTVDRGVWYLPYTGGLSTYASDIDVDHVIPLKWASDHGGEAWSREQKQNFANDPENLLATAKGANRSKGYKGPDQWVPDVGKCQYAIQWRYLLTKYQLDISLEVRSSLAGLCQ
jgi:hypothetical protein